MRQTQPINVEVIIGSTRPGRMGEQMGQWALEQLKGNGGLDPRLLDLLDLDLSGTSSTEKLGPKDFAKRIDEADAFVLVTPEYNHGYPAPLKEAIDALGREWSAKPVGFVSYGGISGGLRAVEQLRQVFAELSAVTVRTGVAVAAPWSKLDDQGNFTDPSAEKAFGPMAAQLDWWASALSTARQVRPYAA